MSSVVFDGVAFFVAEARVVGVMVGVDGGRDMVYEAVYGEAEASGDAYLERSGGEERGGRVVRWGDEPSVGAVLGDGDVTVE